MASAWRAASEEKERKKKEKRKSKPSLKYENKLAFFTR
jgi:hypothetical protein